MKNCSHTFSKFLLLLSLVLCISTAGAQNTIGLVEYDSTTADGYVLFSPMNSRSTYLINKCGKEINRWQSLYTPGASCYLLEDGSMIRAGYLRNPSFFGGGSSGIIEHYNWDGTLRWSYRISSSTQCSHHDFKVMPNGNILVVVWQLKTIAQQIAAGRGPSFAKSAIWSESIFELQPVGTNSANIVWQWNLWDHLIQDSNNTKANFGAVEDHPELVNLNFIRGGLPPADWIHMNAVDYNADLDQIVMSSYTFDEIWVIDHGTTTAQAASHTGGKAGKGGDLLYRWGNPEAYNRGIPDDKKFFHQHNPQWIPSGYPNEGKLIIYNNGSGRPGNELYSSIDIIDPPINSDGTYAIVTGQPYGPTNKFWEYTAPVKTDLYSILISGAQPLKNGSVLICMGSDGEFWEVDSTGKRVWKYINPVNLNTPQAQGSAPSNNSVFRCTFYPSNYSGFTGRNMTPRDEIELNPTWPAPCERRTITATQHGGPYCAGSVLTARYTSDGSYFADNKFYFELSNANGSFTNPLILDSINAKYATPFDVTLPMSLPPSTKYRYRIRSTHPATTGGDNGMDISILPRPMVTFNVPNPYYMCNVSAPVRVIVSGGISAEWDDGNDSLSRLITKPGKYYVTVSNVNACETRDSLEIIAVPFLDVKITATKSPIICEGMNVGLIANGGNLYKWSTGDTTRLLTVTKQGWYKVSSTTTSGGCTGTDSIYVTVKPVPSISIIPTGTLSLCQGDTLSLHASLSPNYYWSTGDTTESIIVSSPGTYTVSTVVNECSGTSKEVTVKMFPAPATPVITRIGDMLTISGSQPVQWYCDGVLIVGATGGSITPDKKGVYTVMVKGSGGCTVFSSGFEFLPLGVFTQDIRNANITISPNPFSDHISIGIQSASTDNYTVECYSVLGEKLSTIHSGMLHAGMNELNYVFPKTASDGVYFVRVQSGAFIRTVKVVRK